METTASLTGLDVATIVGRNLSTRPGNPARGRRRRPAIARDDDGQASGVREGTARISSLGVDCTSAHADLVAWIDRSGASKKRSRRRDRPRRPWRSPLRGLDSRRSRSLVGTLSRPRPGGSGGAPDAPDTVSTPSSADPKTRPTRNENARGRQPAGVKGTTMESKVYHEDARTEVPEPCNERAPVFGLGGHGGVRRNRSG